MFGERKIISVAPPWTFIIWRWQHRQRGLRASRSLTLRRRQNEAPSSSSRTALMRSTTVGWRGHPGLLIIHNYTIDILGMITMSWESLFIHHDWLGREKVARNSNLELSLRSSCWVFQKLWICHDWQRLYWCYSRVSPWRYVNLSNTCIHTCNGYVYNYIIICNIYIYIYIYIHM